ncbi:hypothetical protein D1007_01790 [Hordeum vulgare]|nr:hypothetical protein D1007_01790 [Hordeum vulgare]
MVMEKLPEVNPPSGRVPRRGVLALSISEALQRQIGGEICDSGSVFRVSHRRGKYRPKEGVRGGPSTQTVWWRGQEGGAQGGHMGRARLPSGPPLVLMKLPSR